MSQGGEHHVLQGKVIIFFGLWCYRKGCGFIPSKRDNGARHEVAKFNSIDHAAARYLRNLNTHYALRLYA